MFVFPLGLQARTRDFPWMTLLIAVVTSVYSVFSFDHIAKVEAEGANSPLTQTRFQKQKALGAVSCQFSSLAKADCDLLAKILRPQVSEPRRDFVTRLVKSDPDISQKRATAIAKFVLLPDEFRHARPEISGLREYEAFAQALRDEDQMLATVARDGGLLTRSSFGLVSLIRSLFLHANWSHLLGNMAFFLIFAIPLEQRVGPIGLALIYFIGGSFGMTLQLLLTTSMTSPLLGASACITAVAAAFMVAFWSISVRVWVSFFFVYNQVVRVPTWMFLALFVVLEDVTGALKIERDGVAHVAHLGGFGLGALLGLLAVQMRIVPRPFVFPFEIDLLMKSRKELDLEPRLMDLRRILFYNGFNTVALNEGNQLIEKLPSKVWSELPKAARIFVVEHFCELLIHYKKADTNRVAELLVTAVGEQWPASLLVSAKDLSVMVRLVAELETHGQHQSALNLAKLLGAAFPKDARVNSLRVKKSERSEATHVDQAVPFEKNASAVQDKRAA